MRFWHTYDLRCHNRICYCRYPKESHNNFKYKVSLLRNIKYGFLEVNGIVTEQSQL